MTKLVNESSIPAILREMTVEEKIDLLIGDTFFGLSPKKQTVKKSASCSRIEATTGGAVMSRQ